MLVDTVGFTAGGIFLRDCQNRTFRNGPSAQGNTWGDRLYVANASATLSNHGSDLLTT